MNVTSDILIKMAEVIEAGSYGEIKYAVLLLVDKDVGISVIGMGDDDAKDLTQAVVLKAGSLLAMNNSKG